MMEDAGGRERQEASTDMQLMSFLLEQVFQSKGATIWPSLIK